jgi:hypothetical protein
MAALIPTAAAGLMVAAPAANADSYGCDSAHNVCISVAGGAGGDVTIAASPNGGDFAGTFTVTGPGGYSQSSPDQYWHAEDTTSWTVHGAAAGEYCVSGYSDGGANQGMACEKVS